jgi:hypothetical protein
MGDTQGVRALNPRKAGQAACFAALAAVAVIAMVLPADAATGRSLRVAFIRGTDLWVLDLTTHAKQIVMTRPGAGPVHWSGDGELLSAGGRIVGGPSLPTGELVWAPRGEIAAGITSQGGVFVWTPQGTTQLEPDGWGSTSVAWSDTGRLAIGRTIYGPPHNQELWVWDGGISPPTLAFRTGVEEPYPVAWLGNEVVWWDYPNSASLASDGVGLYVGRKKVGTTLMYHDYVTRCGTRLAYAAGGDRYATHGKRIVLAGRDLSHDTSHSWVSPACGTSGALLVAAAGRNWYENRFGHEHRAIWELQPSRRQLTHPRAGWTDESPQVLADNSILFVRSRLTSRRFKGKWYVTAHAELERIASGTTKPVANLTFTSGVLKAYGYANYYGHYGWPALIAVAP